MACSCTVTNNTGQAIARLALCHEATELIPGSFSVVIPPTGSIPSGGTVSGSADQQKSTDDWWAMALQFAGDPTWYLLSDGLLPYTQCDAPYDGALNIVIGAGSGGTYPCTIETSAKGGGNEASSAPEVLTYAALLNEDEKVERLIQWILDILSGGPWAGR